MAKTEGAKEIYEGVMNTIAEACTKLESECGVPREDAAMLLPLGMTTKIVDRRNLRNLVDMSHQRLCTRAYWEYRKLMADIMKDHLKTATSMEKEQDIIKMETFIKANL